MNSPRRLQSAVTGLSVAETDHLLVTYEERGPANGMPVLLLHGWPDDVRTWDVIAGRLAAAGFRTIAPYLRGFGPTRFRQPGALRTAQLTALASDAIELLSALGIDRAILVGHDWGARIGYIVAALWPERVEHLVAISAPYETGLRPGSQLDYSQTHAFWYQWFFASERGREALRDNRRHLCRYLWQTWAPDWKFREVDFDATAASWDNPDWVYVTLHSYRVRWGHAARDPRYEELETRLEKHPPINVPTTVIYGLNDGCVRPATMDGREASFTGEYRRESLPGVGHFPQRERPQAVANTILQDILIDPNE